MTPATLATLSNVLNEKRVQLQHEVNYRTDMNEPAAARGASEELVRVKAALSEVEMGRLSV